MSESFLPVGLLFLLLSFPIWALTEVVAGTLAAAGRKDHWAGQLLLRASPFIIAVALCYVPGLLFWVAELATYDAVLPSPAAAGLVTGTFATTAHALGLRKLLTDRLVAGVRRDGKP